MNTNWEQRRLIEERLAVGGGLNLTEAQDLLDDADECEVTDALMEGLKEAILTQLGYRVIDESTDDGYVLNLVKVEVEEPDESVII